MYNYIDFFEKENARDLTISQIVETFVPTDTFYKLLTAKNHIVLGSRGSGKTSLAKMISHSHLSLYDDSYIKTIIDNKTYIGIYVPMSTEWLGGVNNKKWSTEVEHESIFIWKLNISVCSAFIDSVKSCCEVYIPDFKDRVLKEHDIVRKIKKFWCPDDENKILNFRQLKDFLKYLDFEKQKKIIKDKIYGVTSSDIIGIEFETDLFTPLMRGIDIVEKELCFPDYTAWLLCLDEAEILYPEQQKIINSYLRSFTSKLFFKIITMPYSHNTRETKVGAPLNLGDDYEYLYIDYESPFLYGEQSETPPKAVVELFKKRIDASGEKYKDKNITIENLLGSSELLDKKSWDFSVDSFDMTLLRDYADEPTLLRGLRLIENGSTDTRELEQFHNQIGRKMRGLLYLKNAVESSKGARKLTLYSGSKMVVRCSDANPRKLIRLFKYLLNRIPNIEIDNLKYPIISPTIQTEVLLQFSESALKRVQSEEKIGPELYTIIEQLGTFMRNSIHSGKINTEQVSSIKIPKDISNETWNIIERAVDNGLLYPNIKWHNSTIMPIKSGEFRLAYTLSPYFRLLPRKGDSRSLKEMLNKRKDQKIGNQKTLFD